MRPLWLAVLAVGMFAGCLDDEAGSAATDDAGDEPPAIPITNVTFTTTTYDGVIDYAVRVPGLVGAPTELEPNGEPWLVLVPADVTYVIFEMTWGDGIAIREPLYLRAISSQDAYYYGAGSGTDEDPAVIVIDFPRDSYELAPVPDRAAVGQGYTIYATLFRGGPAPEGFSALDPPM